VTAKAQPIPLGTVVRDLATDRVGVLADVLDYSDPYQVGAVQPPVRLAFLRPLGGGCEWTTCPDQVVSAPGG
jgi:hypothetical protein